MTGGWCTLAQALWVRCRFAFLKHYSFPPFPYPTAKINRQILYLIELLRSQGMPKRKSHEIFVALIVSRISYALSAWGGFLTVTGQQINRINVFFVKYVVLVFVPLHVLVTYRNRSILAGSLIVNCSRVYKVQLPLSHILPPEKNLRGLRSRGHGYVLPIICQYSFCKNSCIPRCLFHFLYFFNC